MKLPFRKIKFEKPVPWTKLRENFNEACSALVSVLIRNFLFSYSMNTRAQCQAFCAEAITESVTSIVTSTFFKNVRIIRAWIKKLIHYFVWKFQMTVSLTNALVLCTLILHYILRFNDVGAMILISGSYIIARKLTLAQIQINCHHWQSVHWHHHITYCNNTNL